jgi:phosphoglycerol transferase MdoB-like AlkP superfamily enzyme
MDRFSYGNRLIADPILPWIKITGIALVLLSMTRLCLFLQNHNYFSAFSAMEIIKAHLFGARMDLVVLLLFNLPILALWILLILISRKPGFIISILLIVSNLLMLGLNMIDAGYFGFTFRRSTAELFKVIGYSWVSLPGLLQSFWILFMIFFLMAFVLILSVRRIMKSNIRKTMVRPFILKTIVVALVSILIIRGVSDRPVLPSTPLLYFKPGLLSLAGNTPFSMLYSFFTTTEEIPSRENYAEHNLPVQEFNTRNYSEGTFKKKNIIVIVLESLSFDYLQDGNPYRAHTPFLDSVIKRSVYCPNAFSNSIASNNGIVSILGSIPAWMNTPYFLSPYAGNKFSGIGEHLKDKGYSTHFFMGAENDHFGFGRFSRMIGIDHYHSNEELGKEKYFDGEWGTYDKIFFPFVVKNISSFKEPFFAVLFNLSTHYPYALPPEDEVGIPSPGFDRSVIAIEHLDKNLERFFKEFSLSGSYKNTLFVFTADHWFPPSGNIPVNAARAHRIPIFFHEPSMQEQRIITTNVSQVDIVPTIMDFIDYPHTFFAFGESVLRKKSNHVLCYLNGSYNFFMDSLMLQYDDVNQRTAGIYQYLEDPDMKYDLKDSIPKVIQDSMVRIVRKELYNFSYTLTKNRMK